ncbi:MAG: ABC transporter permease subunit [Dehalococcoidia bacterium]|nr:ABC transporter permease subunit [Dehalococcoidia bacterium]MCA9851195.1 ABC transporter permease subunit [Dehalococcoidia bacterium]MCA9857044.1 ABC transporter permease subunit [Dehalococcoidia bacterium]MCB9483614.1 ABC transporter permease subunit [Dehalococcoidia bacterium]
MDLFNQERIPLEDWADSAVDWMRADLRGFFQAVKEPIELIMDNLESLLLWLPDWVVVLILVAVAYRVAGWKIAAFTAVALPFNGLIGMWDLTMTTLAMIGTSVIICVLLGVPLGIAAARSRTFEAFLRPVLDAMQTIPIFVYLLPVVMLFGIGTVSGIIATVTFALAPITRLTALGIREVDAEVVEAAYAFGATPRQVLFDVQMPLALRTIMAGLNQTLMLALSMVVIATLIGAGGLGVPVVRGLNNLQPGVGIVGGTGVVLLAIVLDRITQAMGQGARA